MTRRLWIGAAVLVAAALFAVWATRDRRDAEPSRASIEALVGRPVSAPVYHSSSPFQRWRDEARIFQPSFTPLIEVDWWRPYPREDRWMYTFEAPPSYRVPAPFVCADLDRHPGIRACHSGKGEWSYNLIVVNGRGRLVASLL